MFSEIYYLILLYVNWNMKESRKKALLLENVLLSFEATSIQTLLCFSYCPKSLQFFHLISKIFSGIKFSLKISVKFNQTTVHNHFRTFPPTFHLQNGIRLFNLNFANALSCKDFNYTYIKTVFTKEKSLQRKIRLMLVHSPLRLYSIYMVPVI